MSGTRRRFLVLVLAVAAMLAFVVSGGCGGDSNPSGADGGIGGSDAGDPGGDGGGVDGGQCEPSYPSPEIDVADHGAVGDGAADDSAALQSALATVGANGGTLVFASGQTYLVSDLLELVGASNFGIRGNGATLKVADDTPTDNHCPLSFRDCSDFVVADLLVDGNRQNRTPQETGGGHNIRIRGARDFLFCRVSSNNATTDGFYVAPTDNTDAQSFPADGVFEACHADNNYRQGMSIINGRRLQILDSSFTNTIGTSPQAGVDVEPNGGSAEPGAEDLLFRGCLFEGNEGYGLTMGGAATTNRLTVEGCTFRANHHGAMTIRAGWALVQDNVIEDHDGWVGFNLRDATRCHDVVVRHNTFRNNIGTPTGDAWIYVDADSGTNLFLLENVFENNEDQAIVINNDSGTCARYCQMSWIAA